MITKLPRAIAISVLPCFLVLSSTFAQEASSPQGRPSIETLIRQAEPGPEHKTLAKHVGNWKVHVTMGEGDGASTSAGRAKTHMMMDGRFLWIAYNVSGQSSSFKGAFMLGFDRRNSRYTLTAIDTHGTYAVTSNGTQSPTTGKIKLYGKDEDPNMKAMGFEKEFAHVLDFRDPNEFTIDVNYIDTRTPARREMKAIGFVFARSK